MLKSTDIVLNKLLPIENLEDYKLHLASDNGHDRPLDVFARSRQEWDGWNSYKGKRDDFNREYIFALIGFYPQSDIWLFGGIYKVLSQNKGIGDNGYQIKRADDFEEFIGRLKIHFHRPARAKALKLEKYYGAFILSEVLKESYSGEEFCGCENINHSFRDIENIVKTEKLGWKDALKNIKGVYLITDKETGRRYVGSAYGDMGIWSRWECYINTGHGGNEELVALIKDKGIDYAKYNFSFAILEYHLMTVDKDTIIKRESHWKKVLLTREYGYNKN